MCFVWIWEQTVIISVYSINWLVDITESECIYCMVQTEHEISGFCFSVVELFALLGYYVHMLVHPLTQCYTFWATIGVNQRSANKHVGFVIHYVARRNHFQCYLWKQQLLTLPTSCTSCSCRSCDNVWCRRASCSGVSPSLSGMFRFDPSRTSSCKRTYCR
jgi:hypothetical protein